MLGCLLASLLDPFKSYIVDRLKAALPDRIPATVLFREIKGRGYDVGETRVKCFVRGLAAAAVPEPVERFALGALSHYWLPASACRLRGLDAGRCRMSDLQHERITVLAQDLRLTALPELYGPIAQNAAKKKDASYADFLEDVLKAERDARRVRTRQMLTRTTGFPAIKPLEAYDFAFASGAPRTQIQELASLGFVERAENGVLLRPSGTGKTHLAISFGLIAAQKGWKIRFTTAADIVIAMEAAHRQSRMKEFIHRTVAAPKLLIIDLCGGSSHSTRRPGASCFAQTTVGGGARVRTEIRAL
jgi:DNA replication protein DnaC